MSSRKKLLCLALCFLFVVPGVCLPNGSQTASPRVCARKTSAVLEEAIASLGLPEDTSPRLTVREVRISGNVLVSTDELWMNMPGVFNASDKPLDDALSDDLYDFSVLCDVISQPGQPYQVSARTIRGFTEYILSVYRKKHYAGIYVYVPEDALTGSVELEEGILPVRVVEFTVSEVGVTAYDLDHNQVDEGILRRSLVEEWSPVKAGEVVNQKRLDDFVNLLNLNPDRYVSAIISKGAEPNTLALGYDIYEANPWHYYIQIDNSGTDERQWAPRVGVVNTNLTGMDDRFNAMYQAPWDSGVDDNYALFGSYELPVFTPRLRLNLYAGYSEFDTSSEGGPLNFLGRGSFYGGQLRYNIMQDSGWFLNGVGSLARERSKVTPDLFPTMASDVTMDLLGLGLELHRSNDMSETYLSFTRVQSIGGSSQDKFWDEGTMTGARTNADKDFHIHTLAASHGRYLDQDKIQRLSGSFRWITSNERLVPAKMTAFGGLYSVRGYDEYEAVADGGVLASAQYEFDLVKYDSSRQHEQADEQAPQAEPLLRKLAPLAFVDFGRARNKHHVAGEPGVQELCSVGTGALVELGDNFSGAVYYGYPVRQTLETREGKGRVSVSLILRW
ncbi:MAG: ShlB/FhaC/HecB family hemolysin secretion/activation protein [Planctomycetota bacterium]|jgi:hemolysin activation/secretion protein